MKNLLFLVLIFLGFGFKNPGQQPGRIISEKSKVTFKVSHLTGKVDGTLTGMEGTVNFNENDLEGSFMEATVATKTVDTDNNARDSDLRKDKFLAVDKYPQIRFRSKEITRTASGYQVRGDLTIKKHTREVSIPFKVVQQGAEAVYTGNFTLNRKDYDVGKSGFPPVGKEVEVEILAVVLQ